MSRVTVPVPSLLLVPRERLRVSAPRRAQWPVF